jgi:hypothetical protein
LVNKAQLYVYANDSVAKSMALSEIWTFEVLLKVNKERSDSNSNNSQNKLNFPSSSKKLEIDENHF